MTAGEERPAAGEPAIELVPGLHVSPYELFRRLADGRPPLLFDLRPAETGAATLAGARPLTDPAVQIPPGAAAVLLDGDGREATARARELQAAGFPEVRALFGGLRLYGFALDPAVVGEERFLT